VSKRPDPGVDQWERDKRRVFSICRAFDLGRPERLELATTMFDRNVSSFADLSTAEMARLRDALEGAAIVCTIQLERRRGQRR
jgi:hypothetical protein